MRSGTIRHPLPGVPYAPAWPERWYNLTGTRPSVEPVTGRSQGKSRPGVSYRFYKPKKGEGA